MKVEKIESFKIDHNKLKEGIYISRVDGDVITYDLRMRKPNLGDVIDNSSLHSFEHMVATYIRNSKIGENVIYFGPMGCQTGFYLLVRNSVEKEDVLESLKKTLSLVIAHEGDVFGASAVECGNYRNLDIQKAKSEAIRYLEILNGYEPDFLYEV